MNGDARDVPAEPESGQSQSEAAESERVFPKLFRDHSAGDAIAGVSSRIAFRVVSLGVNHQCRSTARKHGIGSFHERDARIDDGRLGRAVGGDGEFSMSPA